MGREAPHKATERWAGELPKLMFDFFACTRDGSEPEDEKMPRVTILALYLCVERALATLACIKANNPATVEFLTKAMQTFGVGNCVLQTDGEEATVALQKAVTCHESRAAFKTLPRQSPKYSHQSAGPVE